MADLLAQVSDDNEVSSSQHSISHVIMMDAEVLKAAFPGLTPDRLAYLTTNAIAYASAHGMMIQKNTQSFTHVPFSLFPIQFPKKAFAQGVALSTLYCRLVDRVSRHHDWLYTTLESVILKDAFTRKLVELSKRMQQDGVIQKASLGMFRSDYMLHAPTGELQQVELNTIASSFACLSAKTTKMHKYLHQRFHLAQHQPPLSCTTDTTTTTTPEWETETELDKAIPLNTSGEKMPEALAQAHLYYDEPTAVIVFIVQPNEINSVDQRLLEYSLWESHRIPVLRKSLAQMHAEAILKDDKTLWMVNDNVPVSVIYFRAGYTPEDYPTENEWRGRELLERSQAIKCPTIDYHLTGTKKVQQALAVPGMLETFVSPDEATVLRASFAALFSLDAGQDRTNTLIERVKVSPEDYVMKPQREGGGNNYYGAEMVMALSTLSAEDLETFILMSRIRPQSSPAIMVREGVPRLGQHCISELGMFAVGLFDAHGKELMNTHAGHLLRTKFASTSEGGVASGFAVLSSVFLA